MKGQDLYLIDKGLVKQEKNLFHYTNVDAMQKILTDNILLATHIQYMNDWSEYQRGYQILLKKLREIIGMGKTRLGEEEKKVLDEKVAELPRKCPTTAQDYRNFIIKKQKARRELLLPEVYSVSFCGEANLLNQWINYAKENGVCIEFDFSDYIFQSPDISEEIYNSFGKDEIDTVRIYKDCSPIKVVYEEDMMLNIIEKDIVAYLQNLPGRNAREIEDLWWKEMGNVFSIVPFFKHIAFEQEKEIRLAVRKISEPLNYLSGINSGKLSGFFESKVYHIGGGSVLKPRLKLQWKERESSNGGKTPVKSIIVGPGSNQEMTYQSIIHFIEYGLNNITNIDAIERERLEIAESVCTMKNMAHGFVTNKGIIVRKSEIPYIF